MKTPEELIEEWIQNGNNNKVLDLSHINIEKLPYIPDKVERLNLSNCVFITEIKQLPKNLEWLDCSDMIDLISLPLPLPSNLKYIDLRHCIKLEPFDIPSHIHAITHFSRMYEKNQRKLGNFKYFIDKWVKEGKSNKVLDLSWLGLTELPALPKNVRKLNCSWNPLTSICNLPDKLRTLICEGTQIAKFENMPSNLRYIKCKGAPVTSFDGLPNTLRYANIGFCAELKTISIFPSDLKCLHLYCCGIKQIDNLPLNIECIDICDCSIETLPQLPDSLKFLRCIEAPMIRNVTNIPSKLEVLDIDIGNTILIPSLPETLCYVCINSKMITNNNNVSNSIDEIESRTNWLTW